MVSNELVEQSSGFEQTLPRGTVSMADPRSDLLLRFARIDTAAEAQQGKLVQALEDCERLVIEHAAHLTRFEHIDQLSLDDLHAMQDSSFAVGTKVADLIQGLLSIGYDQNQVGNIMQDKRSEEATLFPALLRMLQSEYELAAEAAKVTRKNLNEREVTIQARVETEGQEPKYLHIDGYDDLSAGDMKPRYGGFLGASRDQIANLEGDLRTVERAAGLFRSIKTMGSSTRQHINTLKDQLKKTIEQLTTKFVQSPPEAIDALITALEQKRVNGNAAEKASATTARTAIDDIMKPLATATGLKANIDSMDALLSGSARQSLSSLLGTTGQLTQLISQSAGNLGELVQQIEALPKALKAVLSNLPKTGLQAPAELQQLIDSVTKQLRPASELIALLRTIGAGDTTAEAIESISSVDTELEVWQPLHTASDARIRLGRTGVREGDRVHIEAIYRPRGSANPRDRVTESWEAEIARFGFYPRVGAELIFSRADSGSADAKSWKANAAAVAEAHYRFRNPKCCGAAWNAINPSIGVHISSLDQGDQNVEFGLGVNASILGGFVTGGYGRNLSIETDYWFVGIDLIEVLTGAKGLLGGN